ncbi:MAG: UDP-3-O-(3-hydroxymyristoyl)glucosamine N-acyltransferase [Gammaproteobacteria bacterium]|nr:UDP-3-O-(3-hydroxymyristoyl)glucosamine N-acyltransferase [Gammaproteobacteria bacterium]
MREASVQVLAELVNGKVVGDGSLLVSGVANLASAKSGDLSFLNNDSFKKFLTSTKATAVLVKEADLVSTESSLIVVDDPYLAYAKAATYLSAIIDPPKGIHPSAVVHESARIDESVYIGPNVNIERDVVIGKGTHISSNTSIGAEAKLGADCFIFSNVTIYPQTQLGDRVMLHAGCVLGSDGFGLANDKGAWVKIPQLGRLIVGNDVEIGANSAIDRGALDNTIIHDGVKIDNLVHIAHNIEIGEHTAIAGCVGIAGSTKIGKHCTIAGMAGINGHIEITDNVHIGAMAMVTKSLTEPGQYASGIPAEETGKWRRNVVRFRQMDKLEKRIKQLESELKALKKGI